jgi:periplasmic protein TonB
MSFITDRVSSLNKKYLRAMETCFIITLLLIIAAFKFAPVKNKPAQIEQSDTTNITIISIEPSNQISQPPPPPKPPIPVVALNNDEIQDIILPSTEINFIDNVPPPPQPPKAPVIKDEIVPFKDLESPPEPLGGLAAIAQKLHYTEFAKRADIEGTVVIEILINKNGDVEDAKIIQSLNSGLDEIALQAVKDTKFIPGMQRDKPVRVRMKIPIKFKLQ